MTDDAERMRDDWNDLARRGFMQYTSGVRSGEEQDYVASARRDADTIRRYLGQVDTSGWTALDLGCGAGRIIRELAPSIGTVHGVDVSDEMIRKSTERLEGLPNVELHRIEGTRLVPFRDATFDLMWSYSVLYHLPRKDFFRYLAELSRVMKPDGLMIFQLGQNYTLRRWIKAVFRYEPDPNNYIWRRHYLTRDLRSLAEKNGFKVLAIEPGPGHDLWCHWRRCGAESVASR